MNSFFYTIFFLLMLSPYYWYLEGDMRGSNRHSNLPQVQTMTSTKSLARAVYIINLLFWYSFPKVFSVAPTIKRRRRINCYSVANLCSFCRQQSQHSSKCIYFQRFWFVLLMLFSKQCFELNNNNFELLFFSVGSDANSCFRVLVQRF